MVKGKMLNQVEFKEELEEIKFEYVSNSNKDFELPKRGTKDAAGYDFINPEKVEIPPFSECKKPILVKTGVKSKFPGYLALLLLNRSSNPGKKGLILANGIGLVDADYYNNETNEGEIGFLFINIKDEPVVIEKGDKLGQGMFTPFARITNEKQIDATRQGGFGSTGV